MNCLEMENHVADFLTGSLKASVRTDVQGHLRECASCRSELQDLSELWAKLGVMPVATPSEDLRTAFYAMLTEAKLAELPVRPSPRRWLSPAARNMVFQLAAGLILVAGGWLAGRVANGVPLPRHSHVRYARSESPYRQQIDLSLLDKPNTSKRMLGVTLISSLPARNPVLAQALLNLLYDDPSVQVRLAAVDALYAYSDIPWVREELEGALSAQSSPLAQIALVDLIKGLRDEGAMETLISLAQDPKVSPDVRERALTALSIDPGNLSPAGEYSYCPPSRMKTARAASGSLPKAPNETKGRDARHATPGSSAWATRPREKGPWYVTYFASRQT